MGLISLPGELPFAELVTDPQQLTQLQQHILRTIYTSFAVDARMTLEPPRITESETKRRTEIYLRWFRVMRKDLGYSFERTLDFVGTALKSELMGVPFTPPPATGGWTVPNNTKPMVLSDEVIHDGSKEPDSSD